MSDTRAARSRQSVNSETLDRQVGLYSLAAAAAGVSVLAMASPADAKVVVTQKTIALHAGQPISLDLNRDGIADLRFTLTTHNNCTYSANLFVRPAGGGAIVGYANSQGAYASALVKGAQIGPSAHFTAAGQPVTIERSEGVSCSHATRRDVYGQWSTNPPNRFVGAKFLINGTVHFGWVRLSANFLSRPDSATITAYAYETTANKKISAGSSSSTVSSRATPANQPSLGMLATGVDGLAWRKKETFPIF